MIKEDINGCYENVAFFIIGELEQQIRDLSFFIKTKVQVASSHLKEELQGGQPL
jgi:uncharacterized protein YydD (DUF2326 family)